MNKVFSCGGYQLSCTAIADSGGKFESTLIASRNEWPNRPRVLAMERAKYETAEQAIEAARRQGVKWVDEHG